MELAQRHVERRFLFTDLLQAIHAKIQTFPDTDSGSAYEAKSLGLHGVALPKMLLETLILVLGKRSGQVVVAKGKVLATNQIWRKAMTTVGQVAQQTAEQDEIKLASCIPQRRLLLAKISKPAQQVGIAAQLGKLTYAWEMGVEIGEKSTRTRAIFLHRSRPKGDGQLLHLGFQDVV